MRHRAGFVLSALAILGAVAAAIFATAGRLAQADDPNSAPDPYHVVNDWAKLPDGRHWGMAIGVAIDRDGSSVWVFDRCGGKTCEARTSRRSRNSTQPASWSRASARVCSLWPHGLFAAPDGIIWVTDGKMQTVDALRAGWAAY